MYSEVFVDRLDVIAAYFLFVDELKLFDCSEVHSFGEDVRDFLRLFALFVVGVIFHLIFENGC